VIRAAGGCLHADDAARRLLRLGSGGRFAARRVVLALAASDPGLEVLPGDRVRIAPPQPDSSPIEALRFVVLDLETTGSRAGDDRITEVGAIRVEGGAITGTFHSLVRPDRPIPPAITRLTGIHELILAGAPRFPAIAGALLDFLGNGVLVAHNASFDARFLEAEMRAAGHPPPPNAQLCTMRLARRLLPDLRSCSLDSLAGHFGFAFRARHRAMGDAEVTVQVLRVLVEAARAAGAASLGDLRALARRRERRRQAREHDPGP
jgi:DNA polymerase-3 subunit epsilon